MGPKQARSSVLSTKQKAMVVALRRHTLLSLDDCLYALQLSFPELTRSSLFQYLRAARIALTPKGPGWVDDPAAARVECLYVWRAAMAG